MDQAQLKAIESRCTQEAPPRCRAACPFRMDTRTFLKQIAAGSLAEARKTLEKHLPLPGLLARICDRPCEGRCLRRDLGGSLALGALERLCAERVAPQTKPLPRPPRTARLAVLGNGLAGLTVAFELSKKAYPVVVFYEGSPEALLVRRFPNLDAQALTDELERLHKAGTRFETATLDDGLLQRVQRDYNAVFVDADAAEGLAQGLKPDAFFWVADTVCCAGGLERTPTGAVFASASRQAGEGRRAATTLERLMTGVSLTAAREGEFDTETRLHTPLDGVAPLERVLPTGETYSLDEAAAEAARCLHCECLACVKECAYLQQYHGYPRTHARQIHNNASIVKGLHTANALINGCALCGQCTELCPERFSMSELCLSARQDMVERGFMPPSAHEFALEDMDSANSPECALFMGDPALPEGAPVPEVLFPGCQLAASRGEQVLAVYDFLRATRGATGLFLSCCGVPAHWAGDEARFRAALEPVREAWEQWGRPRLIVACASCLKTFREALSEIPVISLWETLVGYDFPPAPAVEERCSVHDPCTARNDTAWQAAVRRIASKRGVSIEEPRLSGRETACCGYGGLVWNAQPERAKAMTAHRAAELPFPALASCVMCRDRLVAEGKACRHVLDLLPFGVPHDPLEKGPGLSARRTNRAALRRLVRATYLHDTMPHKSSGPILDIPHVLLEELERRHILRQDTEQAVLGVERSGARFQERGSGQYIGSWRPRNVTFWVRYSVREDGFVLHDAWCHRMLVPGAEAPLSGEKGENA